MSKIHKRGPAKAEMNMTPMIDVTFQLIIFFMLVNNIISEETVEMIVPALDEPKVRELDDGERRITVNVIPQNFNRDREIGDLDISPIATQVKLGAFRTYQIVTELEAFTNDLKGSLDGNEGLEVILRADAGTSYSAIQPVMQAIAAAGVSKINLMAYVDPLQR